MNNNIEIKSSTLEFHSSSVSELPISVSIEGQFGILSVVMNKILDNVCVKHQYLVFNIDRSGSMIDKCSDGRTKMNHILFTLENIIRMMCNKCIPCTIYVQTFNDSVDVVINNDSITRLLRVEK